MIADIVPQCGTPKEQIDYDTLIKDGFLTKEQALYIKRGKVLGFEPTVKIVPKINCQMSSINPKTNSIVSQEFSVELNYFRVIY